MLVGAGVFVEGDVGLGSGVLVASTVAVGGIGVGVDGDGEGPGVGAAGLAVTLGSVVGRIGPGAGARSWMIKAIMALSRIAARTIAHLLIKVYPYLRRAASPPARPRT